MATFVDRVTIHVRAGNGGHGCASIRREKFKPLAGPDGANGGHGGDVVFEVDNNVTTLLTYHHSPHRKAGNGSPGAGDMRAGKNGEDLILPIPPGTVVKDENGQILADLIQVGQRFIAAKGGYGGLGNAALASPRRKAPGFALLGEEGEERSLVLELKSVADVALVGFPSAGKSSLISAISAARPKVADYPFTTLIPHLGVVQAGEERYTVADVPGLIPGAAQGKGLGLEFLRHIERCAVIVHVLDCATLEPGRDPLTDLDALLAEIRQYAQEVSTSQLAKSLLERPRIVALNKIDVPEAAELAAFVKPELEARGFEVMEISTVSHAGLKALTFRLAQLVAQARQEEKPVEEAEVITILRPKAVDEVPFTVTKTDSEEGLIYQVRGSKPERWVRQTDFANDEAVGYLADRLEKLGVEEALFKAGAVAGSTVVIGSLENGVIFDWEPTMQAGAELLGPRGTDIRIEERTRATRAEKRKAYHEWMDAKAAAREELWTERQAGHWTDLED